jgi:hypothetical protein
MNVASWHIASSRCDAEFVPLLEYCGPGNPSAPQIYGFAAWNTVTHANGIPADL